MAKFEPGNPGRPKGAQNRVTIAAKEAFQLAFDKLGGWERLAQWAGSDPDNLKTFFTLYALLIPQDFTSKGDKLPAFVVNVPPLPDLTVRVSDVEDAQRRVSELEKRSTSNADANS